MSDEPEWTIRCAGGCGRTLRTSRLTTLFTAHMCPDCRVRTRADNQEAEK